MPNQMNRRSFAKTAAVAAASIAAPASAQAAHHMPNEKKDPFRMKFAPHIGQFKDLAGDDILDQIRYAHSVGFRAWEDNGMPGRPPATQEAVGKLLADLGMEMGVFVAYKDFRNPTLTGYRPDVHNRKRDPEGVQETFLSSLREAVEVAKRCNAKWTTVVPGAIDHSLPQEYQTANLVENLKRGAEIYEKAGLVMVLEPLNYMNHPSLFLQRMPHAYQICHMVGSPAVKILDDLYHQQITEGNLINNMIDAWDEIAYIQVGDVPGRKEPGYDGIVGMEHGVNDGGPEGEKALIQAYREVEPS